MTPYHIRLLVDDPWVGGCGFQGDPGDLTIDQIFMRLVDRKNLLAKQGRGMKTEPMSMVAKAGKDGKVQGRAVDGTPIRAKIGGKSLARQLMEKEESQKKVR